MKEWFKKVYDLGLPLNVHANGDAAIDMLLRAHEYAAAGDLSKDRHVTVIHSQFVRADQLAKYKAYSITPSSVHRTHLLLWRYPCAESRERAGVL